MSARAMFDEAKHPRGFHGRFGGGTRLTSAGAGRARASAVVSSEPSALYEISAPRGVGRVTRRSKLKLKATASHNRRIAHRVVNKGLTITPRDAAMRKARLAMGTHTKRGDARWVLPQDAQNRWVRLNWSKVSARSKMSGR